jgi:hypothetical protein
VQLFGRDMIWVLVEQVQFGGHDGGTIERAMCVGILNVGSAVIRCIAKGVKFDHI